MNTAPSNEELLGLINNEAAHEAARDLAHMSLVKLNGNTLTIGPGTPIETTITLLSNGLLEYPPDTGHIQLNPNTLMGYNIFHEAWDSIARQADNIIRHRAITFLNTPALETRYNHKNRDKPSTLNLKDYPKANNAISPASQEVAKLLLGCGNRTKPAKTGYKILHSLLGKTKVSKVLRIAGSTANLDDFNLINNHLPMMEQAHSLNANAMVYWFSARPNQLPELPQDIIDQARDTFMGKCLNSGFPETTTLWEIFTALHRATTAQHPPSQSHDIYPDICQAISQAGTHPPNTTLAYLLRQQSLHRTTRKLVSALFSESHRISQEPTSQKSQATLREEFEALSYKTYYPLHWEYQEEPGHPPLNEMLRDDTPDSLPDWDTLLQMMETGRQNRIATLPAQPPQARTKRKVYRSPTHPELENILSSPQLRQTRDLVRQSIFLHATPGKTLTLEIRGSQRHYLHIRKRADGTIRAISLNYWAPHNGAPLPTRKNWEKNNWTTRGLVLEAATNIIFQHVTGQWDNLTPAPNIRRPSLQQTAKATKKLLKSTPEGEPPFPNDTDLSQRMTQAISSIPDNFTMAVAQTLGQNPSIVHYNAALTLGDHIPHLHQTNPGALAWAFNTTLPEHPPQHPGQLITTVKKSMKDAGLEPGNWRFATTMPSLTMRVCLDTGNTAHATLMLNAAAKAAATPNETDTWHAVNTIIPKLIADLDNLVYHNNARENIFSTLTLSNNAKENIFRTLTLFIKKSASARHSVSSPADHTPLHIQAIDTVDYVRYMSSMNLPICSTTWGGLIRASHRWHREMNQNRYKQMWEHRLHTTGGYYAAWTSPVPQLQAGEYHLIPILDELGLLEESRAMQHCVYTYAKLCINGDTRIFSVWTKEEEGEKPERAATTQMDLTSTGVWRETQTKTAQNHLPHNSILQAINSAAEQYTNAYYSTPQKERNVITYIHHQTGETADTPPPAKRPKVHKYQEPPF